MNQSSRRFPKFLRNLLFILVGLLIVGAVYQAVAAMRDRRILPPPGQMVEVNGLMMHLNCKGEGQPTVILESGLGGSWIDWSLVHSDIAEQTRTCAYDRLGNGWSDRAATPQSSAQIVATLHDLLRSEDIQPPYVLAGHSAGGVHARTFAATYPDEVSGMILVDSGHEAQLARMPEWVLEERAFIYTQLRVCQALAPIGLVRLSGIANQFTELLKADEQLTAQYVATFNRTQFCGASLDEQIAYERDVSSPRTPNPLGAMPLVVLSRGIGESEEASADDLPPTLTLADLSELDSIWTEMQRELSELSTNIQWIIAEESRHFIQADQPELVIEAVNSILQAVR